MNEENEELEQKEPIFKCEEPARFTPSLLNVDLDKLALEDGEVLGVGELLSQSESGWVVTGRKLKPTAVYFDLPLLFLASLFQFVLEHGHTVFFELKRHFSLRSLSVCIFNFSKSSLIEELH